MKIIHLSDLHLGKKVNGVSLIDDQKDVLQQICRTVEENKPEAVLIAGDVFDKSIPSEEAINLFDDFLAELSKTGVPVLISSGNHDSAERLAFGSRLFRYNNIYISPVYNGVISPVEINPKLAIYMIPFVKPVVVKHFIEDEDVRNTIVSYNDAFRYIVDHIEVDSSKKNVVMVHQFITDSERSDSEDLVVGGLDNVDASIFDKFDYVALGHLHKPQYCGRECVRYCGSPLKYSFSEVNDHKSITIVTDESSDGDTVDNKESFRIQTVDLIPLHDWKDLKGSFNELTSPDFYKGKGLDKCYIRVTLTDENDVLNAMPRLAEIYPHILEMCYDNKRTRSTAMVDIAKDVKTRNPLDLFSEFYDKQNGSSMSDEQKEFMGSLIDKIWNC